VHLLYSRKDHELWIRMVKSKSYLHHWLYHFRKSPNLSSVEWEWE
jgi:hypothetical protein